MRVRYRPFQAVAIAALAALITACAAFAPLYDRAMQQALTGMAVASQDDETVGLQVIAVPVASSQFGEANQDRAIEPEQLVSFVPDGVLDAYLDPIPSYSATVTRAPGQIDDPSGPLVWRSGQCAHVAFVAGACPKAAGDIAVSEKDASGFGLRVGTRLGTVPIPGPDGYSARLTVTGIYRPHPDGYWFGLDLTGRSGLSDPAPGSTIGHDVWLTSSETFTSQQMPTLPDPSSSISLPLDRDHADVDRVIALGADLQRLEDASVTSYRDTTLSVRSGLGDIADDVQSQTDQSRVTVPLLMAQLGLLALVVLWLVLLAVTEQRRPEVALARLRGRGRRGARGLLLGELLPVALAGVVPGALLAVLGAWFARNVVLPADPPFELGLRFVVAVVLSAVVLTAVTMLAVARVAREPVETLLRRVPPRRAGWALGVPEALLIAGAGAIFVVFATGGLDGPVALAAPGLLAIVVGLVLAHLTTPTASVVGGRLLRRGRVLAGMSVVDAARSPATRRIVAIVTLAAALAVFASDALLVGDRNRAAAAEQEVGARLVAHVAGNDLAGVRAALDQVDPDGREVTPVVRVAATDPHAGGTLAVVPGPFRRIAMFPGGGPSEAQWDGLRLPDDRPIRFTGTHLSIEISRSTLRAARADGELTSFSIGLDLAARGEILHTTLGRLDGPDKHVRLQTDVSCGDGCFVTAVWFGTLPGASIHGRATLHDLTGTADGRTTATALGPADRWTPNLDPTTGRVRAGRGTPDELTVQVESGGAALVSMRQSWLPTTVPALVAGKLPPGSEGDHFSLNGLDGEEQPLKRVADIARVPASRANTSLVNLDLVQRGRGVSADAAIDLWFVRDDPALLASVTKALADQDVSLSGTSTLAGTRSRYDDSAAAWSLQLAVLIGIAALLIALLVLVVSALSGWRFRTRDLAALRMSGVPGRSIASTAIAAQLPAVLIGVLTGAVCGVVGAQLALPIVPLFASAPQVSTLDLDTAWGAVVTATAAALLVLAVGSGLIGREIARRSELQRLRETM